LSLENDQSNMTAHALPRRHKRHNARSLLVVPFAILGLLGVGALVFVSLTLRPTWRGTAVPLDAPAIPATVAGVLFDVPPAAIRAAVQRHAGPHERMDLAFMWPSLTPPPADAKPVLQPTAEPESDATAAPADTSARLFVSIAPLGTVLPPTERLRTIYTRYVEAEATAGQDGLAILPFRAGSPYAGEDLVYFADNAEQFFARCTRQGGTVPGTCIHERVIGAAEITFRFPRSWIGDWRNVTAGFDRLVGQLHPERN
jgi:hypothetical protein